MTKQRFPFKASTLCAGGTLLVLGGFLSVNLAGCGGGGGGGVLAQPTPRPLAVTFQLLLSDGTASRGGSVTLTGPGTSTRTYTATANAAGVANLSSVPPGTYSVVSTVIDSAGTSTSTTRTVVISDSGTQNFTLLQGDTGSGQFLVSGRAFLNPSGLRDDPDNDITTANCTAQSEPITSRILISVRDLDTSKGRPIIAQVIRALQPTTTSGTNRGRYSVSLPYRPQTFRVEVTEVAGDAPEFAGFSALTTYTADRTLVERVDICTNQGNIAPGTSVTATPTATSFMFPTPVGTRDAPTPTTPAATATVAPTVVAATATPRPSATPQPTNTSIPDPGITPVVILTPTPAGGATPTSTPFLP